MDISSVHIIGGKGSGGAERFFVRLVNALAESGQPTTAMTVAGSLVSAGLQAGIPQWHIPMRSIWDLSSRWQISRSLRRLQAHIVQTYMSRATRLTHIKKGHPPVHVARLGGYYNLKYYRHAHAWVGNTKGICDYLINSGLPAKRIACISNFVDVPVVNPVEFIAERRRQLGLPDSALLLTAVGRLHPAKGFEDLLSAFTLLPTTLRHRSLYLVVVGDGPLNGKLQQYAGELGVADRVRWMGWQTDPGIYYDLADLFICPSRYEPLGNVILEAWMHCRPVVSTRTAGALELIANGEDAWLVPPEQPQALAEAIRQVLQDDHLRQQLARKGHQKVQVHYSQQAIVSAYLDFYDRLLRM